MSLAKAMKEMKFDKRLIEWYMEHGQLTKEELQAHLEKLPDMGYNIDLSESTDDDDMGEQH